MCLQKLKESSDNIESLSLELEQTRANHDTEINRENKTFSPYLLVLIIISHVPIFDHFEMSCSYLRMFKTIPIPLLVNRF